MPSDIESELSEVRAQLNNPFSIAARSTSSSVPAKHTRNFATRRPILPTPRSSQAKSSYPPASHQLPITSESLATIPTSIRYTDNVADDEEDKDEDRDESEIQGPESTFSRSSSSSLIFPKQYRSKTSLIHEHCSIQNRSIGECYICNHCKKAYKSSGGTRLMRLHLAKYHGIDLSSSGILKKRQRDGTAIDTVILRGSEINKQAEEKRRKELMGIGLNKTTLEFLYIQWIVNQDLPFNQVSQAPFRSFIEYINPVANRMLPDSPVTIKSHAEILFQEGKARIRHLLATALSDIHITCDTWSSPNHLGLLAIIAHFTNDKWDLITINLALVEIQGDHSGYNQAQIVLSVLDDFGIRGKLGYFVMDNVTSNDILMDEVAFALQEHGIYYNPGERRLRCNGHIINLSVQAFLFGRAVNDYEHPQEESPNDVELNQWRRLGPLGKLHNIIVWIMGSPQRIQMFRQKSGGLMPLRDNRTRWNSWYLMIDWAIFKIKPAIIAISNEEDDLADDVLTSDDWKLLTYIRNFLQGFFDATKATEGRHATLDRVLPTMDFLIDRFEKAANQFAQHPFMRESIEAGYTKLLKYWNRTERSPVYIAAIVLDPTQKWSYFDDWDPSWQPNMKQAMRAFWESTYRSSTGLPERPSSASIMEIADNEFLQWRNRRRPAHSAGDEYDQYINEPLLLANDSMTAIDWWRKPEQQTRLPLLSKMAFDIYSIPAMSSEPERVFSGAKHTISDQRNALKSLTIELLEYLKSWFRNNIFTEEDLSIAISTAEESIQ